MAAELNIVQEPRLLEITSPLGPGVLTLRRLSVQEEIGRPFTLAAEVVSEDLDLQPNALIGKPITCSIKVKHTEARYVHGIVRSFSRLGP